MIGECLDVLPDILYYHRLVFNDICPSRTACGFFFSAANKILVDQVSSGRQMISRVLGSSLRQSDLHISF